MFLPAAVVIGGGVTLCFSPTLIFGWEPLPPLGLAGAGVALLIYYYLGSVALPGPSQNALSSPEFFLRGGPGIRGLQAYQPLIPYSYPAHQPGHCCACAVQKP